MNREEILKKVSEERDRQDAKFGANRNQHPAVWSVILSEEVGEFAQEICEADFDSRKLSSNYEKELIQIAAVAVAAIENIKYYQETPSKD